MNSLAANEYRLIERLGGIREELHYVQNRMYYMDSIPGAIHKIAEVLNRPTFWQRVRIRVMNWRWRRRIEKGLPQKEWSEKSREALAAFEKKIEAEASAWRPLWH